MKRELLGGVVHSILLYGASVWAETLTARRHKEILTRKVLIRMARADSTASTEALLVITGIIPIELMVEGITRLQFRV